MRFFFRPARRPSIPFVILLASGLFTALLGLFYFGVFRPDVAQLATLHLDLLQRERAMALSAKLRERHPNVIRRLQTNEAASQSRLGVSNPAVELMTSKARKHDLDLTLVEPGSVERIGNQQITPVVLHLNGEYADFLSWLRELESSDVLVTVDQVFMEGSPTGRHTFSVSLSTYTFGTKG